MSKLDDKKEHKGQLSRGLKSKDKSRQGNPDNAHLNHVAVTRNMPAKDQAPEAPMTSSAGLGGRLSAGARPPGTINEAPLTTATGTGSESEQRIAASPYGKVLPPQLTSEGKFRCRCCNQLFDTSDSYGEHYRQNHLSHR